MASSTEQAIRVTAQGEFGQLQRGLKDLQGDLKNVLGEIDKGARKGGIFDDTQLRALDVYKRRFKESLADLNSEFEKQHQIVEQLNTKMRRAYAWERDELKEQIKQRRENLEVIDRTRRQLEQTYQRRNTEVESYGSSGSSGRGGSPDDSSSGGLAMVGASSILARGLGALGMVGKFALGLAGITSVLGMATEAYQLAYSREVGSLDLAQRLRGNGFSGSNSDMHRQVSAIGRSSGMGYSAEESWQLQDAYTSEAGALGASGQLALQKFSRGYGLDATTVGGIAGDTKQMGGITSPKQFADMIAGSVEKSGMVPRILEVMKAHSGLLQNLNTTFKDGASNQILAYQTTLDRLGNENGMTRLTGAQGANVIGGLGGIYQPDNDKWKWMGITALQKYDPKKYSGMGLYDLESSFEDGIQNPDNIPAMAKYLKSASGGNNDNYKRLMQSWLTEGGFKATKSEVTELDRVTGGFTAFDPGKIDSVLGTDSGAKYGAERKDEFGQSILDIESRFKEALTGIGGPILTAVTELKGGITNLYEGFKGDIGFSSILKDILGVLGGTATKVISPNSREGKDDTDTISDLGLGTVAKVVGGVALGRAGYLSYKALKAESGASYSSEILRSVESPNAPSSAEQSLGTRAGNLVNRLRGRSSFYSPEGLSPTEPISPPPSEVSLGTRAGRLVNRFRGKGGGGGALGAIGFLPTAVDALEVHKENPDASMSEFVDSLLDKLLPGWQKVMNPAYNKDNQGDSDIATALDNVNTTGRTLTKFSTDGTEILDDLGTKGSTTYSTLELITTTKLDEIKEIHRKFYDDISKIDYSVSSSEGGDSAVDRNTSTSGSGGLLGWLGNVWSGITGKGASADFFKGWQNRVTSSYGEDRGNRRHSGLDIDAEQGEELGALAGGTISNLQMDDGGQYDADGVKNTRMGGTEMVVRMANGKSYSYSHMSKVNAEILSQWQKGNRNIGVDAGDNLGLAGGDRNVPGSGYSTTGSHLHLGYTDENGNTQNPEDLLKSLSTGDSNIAGSNASGAPSKSSHITVDVNLSGEGVSQLNSMTMETLKYLIQQGIEGYKRQQLAMNPTATGW